MCETKKELLNIMEICMHHFLLRAIGGALSDADVEVTEVAWVPLSELSGRLAYADERALVERAPALLADSA